MGRRKKLTRGTGVVLELPVYEYLNELGERDQRDRSFCINQIVREHAARQGTPLASPYPREPDAAT